MQDDPSLGLPRHNTDCLLVEFYVETELRQLLIDELLFIGEEFDFIKEDFVPLWCRITGTVNMDTAIMLKLRSPFVAERMRIVE